MAATAKKALNLKPREIRSEDLCKREGPEVEYIGEDSFSQIMLAELLSQGVNVVRF